MRWIAALVFALCLSAVALVPPYLGLANNGDFPKVAGHVSLGPVDGGASNFLYFQPDYIHTVRYQWDSPYASCQTLFAWLALHLSGATAESAHFDIRVLGALHLILWVAALCLVPLRGRYLWLAALAIFIFSDICYSSYLNTFYMDAAALTGFFLLVASAVWIVGAESVTIAQIAITTLSALIYVTSKTQHAIWFLLPVALLLWTARRRRLALAGAAMVFAGGLFMFATADPTNRDQALFNKLFFQIGTSPDGPAALRALGVLPEEMRYIGIHSFKPGTPAADSDWVSGFYRRTGYPRLFLWYLRHPSWPLSMLWNVLCNDAPEMRQVNLSNYRKQDGHAPGARTNRFALWSDARSWLTAHVPWIIPLWYTVFAIFAVRTARAGTSLGWVGLGIAILGAGHFALAALADCLETGRHLLLFQACTEVTILFALAWTIRRLPAR